MFVVWQAKSTEESDHINSRSVGKYDKSGKEKHHSALSEDKIQASPPADRVQNIELMHRAIKRPSTQ